MLFSSRIRTRASRMKHGQDLLDIASREDVRREMRRRMCAAEKPVTALSTPMLKAFGAEAARDDKLRQLAGEIAAHISETEHHAVRASGSRKIIGDAVFTSGQPFRLVETTMKTPNGTGSVERWGEGVAVCLPMAIVNAANVSVGEDVDIEVVGETLVIRPIRALSDARRRAEAAADAIVEDSRRYSLGDLTIRDLREEGRRE